MVTVWLVYVMELPTYSSNGSAVESNYQKPLLLVYFAISAGDAFELIQAGAYKYPVKSARFTGSKKSAKTRQELKVTKLNFRFPNCLLSLACHYSRLGRVSIWRMDDPPRQKNSNMETYMSLSYFPHLENVANMHIWAYVEFSRCGKSDRDIFVSV